MSDLLADRLNLQLLELICSGQGVAANVNALAKELGRHRNTIKTIVEDLFAHSIIDRPVYPFNWMYREYPLMVTTRAQLPRNEQVEKFLKTDKHIFGAFQVRDEQYNTFLIEFHRDLFSYGQWRDRLVEEQRIPPRESRYPSDCQYFSTRNIIKHQPPSLLYLMEQKIDHGETILINDHKLTSLGFQVLKNLLLGNGLRTNENLLSRNLGLHRKTIERRLEALIEADIIGSPRCRFPNFLVSPHKLLVYSLVELKDHHEKILDAIMNDPHVPMVVRTNIGSYNLALFKVFFKVEDQFRWEEEYDRRFPGGIGAMKKLLLCPKMTTPIDQQKVSLGILRDRLEGLGRS